MDPAPSPPHHAAAPRSRAGRAGRTAVLVLLGLVVVGIGFVAGLLGRATLGGLVDLPGTEVVDRSQPAVLVAVRDLAELRAASGQYSVVLDVEEDVPFLPGDLLGERTLFVALGTVDAVVDLADLDEDAVELSADGTAVEITLPPATLDAPDLDVDGSYVYDRQRGLLNQIGDALTGDVPESQPLYQQARDELADAAADSDLQARAEANTRRVLAALLDSLGFADVTVTFDEGATAPSTGR